MAEIIDDRITSRWGFGDWCRTHSLNQILEVGTDRGDFISDFLKAHRNTRQVVCIDPYLQYPDMPWDREPDFLMAMNRLAQFRDTRLIRVTSDDFLNFCEQSTDPNWLNFRPEFIYIDADHRYEYVKRDITRWWERLSPIGMLAGHDFDDTHPDVMQAVRELAVTVDRDLYIVNDPHELPSWYIQK